MASITCARTSGDARSATGRAAGMNGIVGVSWNRADSSTLVWTSVWALISSPSVTRSRSASTPPTAISAVVNARWIAASTSSASA